jgi:hypothetical protein
VLCCRGFGAASSPPPKGEGRENQRPAPQQQQQNENGIQSSRKTEYKAAGKDALKTEGPLKNDIGKQKLKRKGEDPTIPRLPLVISFLLSKVTSCFYVCS